MTKKNTIKIYKVTLPSYYAWPDKNIILKVCYTEADADRFIENYPNPFLRAWLKIETDTVRIDETD